jgi:hypothetical protein
MSPEHTPRTARPVPRERATGPVRRLSWIRLGLVASGLVALGLGASACICVWRTGGSAPFATVAITLLVYASLIVPGLMLVQVGARSDDPPDE